MKIAQDEVRLGSVAYPGGPLTYPGVYRRTWVQICPGVWLCIGMEPAR